MLSRYHHERAANVLSALPDNGSRHAVLSPLDREQAESEPAASGSSAEQTVSHGTYAELAAENPDYAGWVSIDGTNLDYPVLSADEDDPEFYLNHDFERNKAEYGVPFLDSRCDVRSSDNLIVYGHHTVYETMFSALHGYLEKSFWKKHPTVVFETADGKQEYEIFAALTAKGEYTDTGWSIFKCVNMNEIEFDAMCEEVSIRSRYDTGIKPDFGDKLLTLVTCEYSQENGRLVVLARQK